MSVVTIVAETEKRLKPNSSPPINFIKSMDNNNFTSSAKFSALSRRKMSQRQRDRNPTLVPVVSEIKQRVMSARMLRMKQLQNQLGESHHRIAELIAENRLLKAIHKRQDSALAKYENSSAELPQLLQSHSEELRVWQTRSRNLQKQNKELHNKIKQKDQIILTITDQNKHLTQLNKDKTLEEREKLTDRVKELEQKLVDKDNDIKLLARRLQIETKTFKNQLHAEQQKYRDLVSKLEQTHIELSRINGIPEINGKKSPRLNRLASSGKQQQQLCKLKPSKSQCSLANSNSSSNNDNSLTPTLPTFFDTSQDNNDKKSELEPEKNHSKVKLFLEDHDEKIIQEIEDTDRTFFNGNHIQDNGINRLRNGSSSQKSQIPKPTKLSPIHRKSQESSKKSSDTEFSDDDGEDEFLFFNENADVKTDNTKKLNELIDHKKHIEELEAKMRHNSLLHQENFEVPELLDQKPHNKSNKDKDDLLEIDREIRESIIRRETMLDSFCDDFTDSSSEKRKNKKKEDFNNNHTSSVNQNSNSNSAKKLIDPKKKKNLLAALKEIDGTDSFDK